MKNNTNKLYQDFILDNNRHPLNYHAMPNATLCGENYNPMCGDHIMIMIKLSKEGTIDDISFQGDCCAITKASASLMTETLKHKTKKQAHDLYTAFHCLLDEENISTKTLEILGELSIFKSVTASKPRIKCAKLAWDALKQALSF